MLPIRSSESPGPKVVLVLGEPRTAPEDLHQEISLRETARCPKESDRPSEGQDRVGILRDDVDGVRDQEDRDGGVLLQPIEGPIEHVLAADVYHVGRLVEEVDILPIEDGPAEEDAEERRLARAVRADDGERGPSPHVEIDVFQNRDAVQSNPEIRDPEEVFGGAGFAGWTR